MGEILLIIIIKKDTSNTSRFFSMGQVEIAIARFFEFRINALPEWITGVFCRTVPMYGIFFKSIIRGEVIASTKPKLFERFQIFFSISFMFFYFLLCIYFIYGSKFDVRGPLLPETRILPLKCGFGYLMYQPNTSAILGFGVRPKPKQWFRSCTRPLISCLFFRAQRFFVNDLNPSSIYS